MKRYRLKLVSKGQMTAPRGMRADLRMKEGDELELLIEDDRIVGAQVLKPMPAELFTPELFAEIEKRARRFPEHEVHESDLDTLKERVAQAAKQREVNARKTHSQIR
jgi:AbrB family looped-hinge helix DNA binding protein